MEKSEEALEIQCPLLCIRIVSKRCVRQFTLRFAGNWHSIFKLFHYLLMLIVVLFTLSLAPLYLYFFVCLFLRSMCVNSLWKNAFKLNSFFFIFILFRLFALIFCLPTIFAHLSSFPFDLVRLCQKNHPVLDTFINVYFRYVCMSFRSFRYFFSPLLLLLILLVSFYLVFIMCV